MEIVVFIDNCMICGNLLNENKTELNKVTTYSQTPIFKFIEEFTDFSLNEDIKYGEYGVCYTCFAKFNEYDEYQSAAVRVQQELVSLFDQTVSGQNIQIEEDDIVQYEDEEKIIKEEHEEPEEEEFIYESIELSKENDDDKYVEYIGDDIIETIEPESAGETVESIDREKLPKKYQSPDEKPKVFKSKSVSNESDEGITVVKLENNVKLYQVHAYNLKN